MYFWTSELVSEAAKKKIMFSAHAIRTIVRQENEGKPDFHVGHRFNDDEQVFQAFCQKYLNTAEKAKDAETLLSGDRYPLLIERALIDAAYCDYYYEYEKQWN